MLSLTAQGVRIVGDSEGEAGRQAGRRFLYDIIFFILITTIGLNIVFGIILDTFSELREARVSLLYLYQLAILIPLLFQFSAEKDIKSTCFICSLPSYRFDKKDSNVSLFFTDCGHNDKVWLFLVQGFTNHIKKEHCMEDYIYYSIYLDQVDTSNHNAIEKQVYDKVSGL